MEPGYTKADNRNLPRVDIFMIGNFFSANSDFCAAEFRNIKTSVSARQSYGDDAIGYVQIRRDNDLCTIKCKVCPEHRVRSKSYAATMIVDEKEGKVLSVSCHDCAASTGGCKHAVAFLMWVHRRSEEPSSTEIQCYWKKSKLAQVGTNIKFITTKDMAVGKKIPAKQATENNLLTQFLEEATNRGLRSCELLNYNNYRVEEYEKCSLHYLIIQHCAAGDANAFLNKISPYFTEKTLQMIEVSTKAQYKSRLWHELRYGRVTASKAYEVSKCHTTDGSLMAMIMGAKTPDTKAMKRGRELENKVRVVVENILGKKIKECGLFISPKNPFLAGSPDGIYKNQTCIEIKCPTSEKTYKNYIKNGNVAEKYMVQMQIQMYVTNLSTCYFCVADSKFEVNNKVEMLLINYDETLVKQYILKIKNFWVNNVYPILCDSAQ